VREIWRDTGAKRAPPQLAPWPFPSLPLDSADMGLLGLLKKMKKDWDLGMLEFHLLQW
jgi:hypothetical protein